jgi:hypothetical protein
MPEKQMLIGVPQFKRQLGGVLEVRQVIASE